MRDYAMESGRSDSGVRVKVEPMSQQGKLSTASSLPKCPIISVKKELGGRLASFKPPRDLSLGGASSHLNSLKTMMNPNTTNKKVFVPNVNVTRRKGISGAVTKDLLIATDNIKPSHERNRKTPRNRGNFVQTQGVFSEGLGRAKPREYSRGSDTSTTPILEKPKLNLNRNTSKKKEDIKMKEILRDDIIDDPSIVPNLADPPISLPLLLNPKVNDNRDLETTFESLQVKTGKSEPQDIDGFAPKSPKIMKVFHESSSPRLVIFEFPNEIIKREDDKKPTKEIKHEKGSKPPPPIKEETNHRLSNLREGLWGTLKILDNGAAYIAVGKERIPVQMTRYCPRQNVMSVELDSTSSKGELVNLGRVSGNLTCSSDLTFSTQLK